jgi:DNA-directed RNA polymerase specialized sigma24 family protein
MWWRITHTVKPNNREVPFLIDDLLAITIPPRPEDDWQALMEAVPGNEPAESKATLQPLREAVADCIDMLSEQDSFIINAMNSEQITYDELGKRLGVSLTHAWRLRNAAYKNLEQILERHGVIRQYLRMD